MDDAEESNVDKSYVSYHPHSTSISPSFGMYNLSYSHSDVLMKSNTSTPSDRVNDEVSSQDLICLFLFYKINIKISILSQSIGGLLNRYNELELATKWDELFATSTAMQRTISFHVCCISKKQRLLTLMIFIPISMISSMIDGIILLYLAEHLLSRLSILQIVQCILLCTVYLYIDALAHFVIFNIYFLADINHQDRMFYSVYL